MLNVHNNTFLSKSYNSPGDQYSSLVQRCHDRRAHVLFTLFVFVWAQQCPSHIDFDLVLLRFFYGTVQIVLYLLHAYVVMFVVLILELHQWCNGQWARLEYSRSRVRARVLLNQTINLVFAASLLSTRLLFLTRVRVAQ